MRLKLGYQADEALLRSINFYRDRLYVARTLIPKGYEPFFRQRARYDNAHSSTKIEGNQLPEQQALLVLMEGADASAPAEVEKTNLDEAYELMAQIARDKATAIDAGLIKTMHSIILRNLPDESSKQRGRYRVGGVRIADSKTKETRYVAPPPLLVPELMDAFTDDMRSRMATEDGAVVSALVHFGLISIHPFLNGNGRTARLMADMALHLADLSADGMLASNPTFFDRRAEYYDILREVQGPGFLEELDVTEFVRFHVNALGTAAAELEQSAIGLNKRIDELKKEMGGVLNERQCLGLAFLLDFPHLSTQTYARLVGTSRATASKDLADMVEGGLLERVGAGRNTRHRLHPSIRGEEEDDEANVAAANSPANARSAVRGNTRPVHARLT